MAISQFDHIYVVDKLHLSGLASIWSERGCQAFNPYSFPSFNIPCKTIQDWNRDIESHLPADGREAQSDGSSTFHDAKTLFTDIGYPPCLGDLLFRLGSVASSA